jgi:transcriptional regulator with XRE-family HTH domain
VTERPHGYARYRLDGCRCYTCGFARSQYDENRNRAIAYGTWNPWVDAAPVRAHLATLRECGIGLRRIAELTGCARSNLAALTRGRGGRPPSTKVRPALAAAVLAIEPTLDNIAAKVPVSALGSVRRLQALVAAGWPQAHLAQEVGIAERNMSALLRSDRVYAGTARTIRDVFGALWNADPVGHGATPGGINRSRRRAAANGWAPPAAWDDDTIDDPQAHPDWTGKCGTPEGYNAHYAYQILPTCQPCRTAKAAQRRTARKRAAA